MPRRGAALWRALLSWLFLLLFCLAAPVALVTGWAYRTTNDPEAYARTVRATAADPRVERGLARAVGLRAESALAGENPTATDVIQARVFAQALGDAASRVIARPEFADVWETANRDVFQSLVSPPASARGEPVILDLSPLAAPLQNEVEALDLDLPPDVAIAPRQLRITVLDEEMADRVRLALPEAPAVFRAALALTLLALVLALALAPDRLRATARAAFGLTIAMVALMAVLLVAQGVVARAARASGADAALIAVMDAVSQELRLAVIGLTLAGLLLTGIFAGVAALRPSMAGRVAKG